MSISLGNAISSIKKDPQWVKKILIGGFVNLAVMLSSALINMEHLSTGTKFTGFIIYLLFGAIISGFLVATANKQINSDSNAMADWSGYNPLFKGLKFIFSYIVYIIVTGILFTIIGTILMVICGIVLGIIYYIFNAAMPISTALIKPILGIIFVSSIIVLGLYYMQYICTGIACYYKNERFSDLMALKKQLDIINFNKHTSWTLIGKFILYALLFILIVVILCITIVGILALPFVYFAAHVAAINLYSQYAKEIEIEKYLT